jgi:hypothetical protein
MAHKYAGGCDHVHTYAGRDPIDNHICHCPVCKGVTGQATTHVVFFKHSDLSIDNPAGLKRQPSNSKNPNGPLELRTCARRGKPIMLDDKQRRIRAMVPNPKGYDAAKLPASCRALYDATTSQRPSPRRLHVMTVVCAGPSMPLSSCCR